MSDQSTDLRDTQYVGAGGGGIQTINAANIPNQFIVAGPGILVSESPIMGSHMITNLGVYSLAGEFGPGVNGGVVFASVTGTIVSTSVFGPPNTIQLEVNTGMFVTGFGQAPAFRQGNINLVAGSGVTITEGPNGTFTFDALFTNGVNSVGLPGTPRNGTIVIKGGANVIITEGPNGTFTFDTGGAAGIVSINGDAGAAQVISGTAPITITNSGGGNHTIAISDYTAITKGSVPSPVGFSPRAGLDPLGWFNRESVGQHSPFPGNNAPFTNGVSNFVTGFDTGYAGKVVIVGSVQVTNPVAAPPGAYIALTISVGGIPVRTMQLPVNNFVPPYIQVTWIGDVLANQQIFLYLYNGTGETIHSRGYDLDLVGMLRS